MLMILRKKEIVAAAMVVLVGMAGYLNWHYQDNVIVRDSESYIEAGKKIGEAEMVINDKEVSIKDDKEAKAEETDYFVKVRQEREVARSKSLEILNETAANESFDDDIRKKAQEKIVATADDVENEVVIENLAKAKGYENVCVYISEDSVNITVQKDEFNDEDASKIQKIATEQLKILPNKVKIIAVK